MKLLKITIAILSLSIFSLMSFNACDNKDNDETSETPEPADTNANESDLDINWQYAMGTVEADDFAGAVMDASGNVYLAAVSQPDGYAANVIVSKINIGSANVEWTKTLDLGDQDYFPSPSENGHSQGGGGSRCISIDDGGNIYIAGGTKQGFFETFVLKMDADGQILWQTFWEGDNSGLARGNAKAYALHAAGDKVFVTGTTGGGVATEEALVFLLTLEQDDGSIDTAATHAGIEISEGYNDRGYTIFSPDGNDVYIGGWEGKNNSGLLIKLSNSGKNFEWYERIGLGTGARITDIDMDASANLYLAADLRGVSTYQGVLKLDDEGNLLWGKKHQGESNDRNNISCVRIIDEKLYVGGKSSYADYDDSQWGDGSLLKFDLDGDLLKQYNYYVEAAEDHCGERIEAILSYNNNLILLGETWPEYSIIEGNWFEPEGTVDDLNPSITKQTTTTIYTQNGAIETRQFTESTISLNLNELSEGSQGSADIIVFNIDK